MITMTNMSPYGSNRLNFGKKLEPKEQNSNSNNSISSNVTKPIRTGLLVTSAFLAGLGTTTITGSNNNKQPIEYQESTTYNRPPKEDMRDWYVSRDVTSEGKTYTLNEHYVIKEHPFLVATTVVDKKTQNVEFRDTLYDYIITPYVKNTFDPKGKLLKSREYTGFVEKYKAPEKAQIKSLLTDGTYDIEDIEYRVNIKYSNPEQEAKRKAEEEKRKAEEKKRADEEVMDIFNRAFD